MTYSAVGLGSTANDGTGDTLRAAGTKINANNTELYSLLGGTGISGDSGGSASAGATLTSPTIAGATSATGVVTFSAVPVFSAGINVSGGTIAGTLSTAAQTNITSLGTLTALSVDNITINTNTISSTGGTDLLITPLAGQQIVLDGTIVIDAGVVTGATSITSTAFVGDITGDVTGNADTVTVSANNSTNETVYPVFVDGATGTQGAETDTGLNYNPSTGLLTSAGVTADLTGTFDVALGSDAEGDTYYRNSSGNFVRLARGTDNYVLTMNGNVPNWEKGGARLFGISDDFLTNTRVVDATDVGITTTAADVGSAISAQTLAAGDVIALWIVEACMAAAGAAQVSFGIEVNSTDYFAVGQNYNGTFGFFGLSNVAATHIRGLRGPFAYSANGQIVTANDPAILLFDVDGLGIATGSQTIQVRIKEFVTSAGATLQGSAGFDTRIAWALLKGS